MDELLIMDSTLRDGSHAKRHKFTKEEIIEYSAAAEKAGIKLLIVGHGNGLGASSLQIGKSLLSDREFMEAAKSQLKNTKMGVLILPGFGTIDDDLEPAFEIGADVVFCTCHCTEADTTERHIRHTKSRGKTAIGVMMMVHMVSEDELLLESLKFQEYGADGVLLMDSAGALLPEEVGRKISKLVSGLDIDVGFHAHNNLGMAVANSLAAIDAGAKMIDTTSRGFGAGAGNCSLELLVAALHKRGMDTGMDLYGLMDNSDKIVAKFMEKPPDINGITITSGIAGVFSGFCPIAIEAGERFGVDPRDILMELGKRRIIAGQEDYISHIAIELSEKKKKGEQQDNPG
jgi:4-hydroxy 2-oxovalerate aldolase